MKMTEEALLEIATACSKQIGEMEPDDDNLNECRELYQNRLSES